MSTITLLLALLGIASIVVLFYFLRFKASSRQTDRDNRIPWNKIFFQRERYNETKASLEKKIVLRLVNKLQVKMMLILKIKS